MERTDAECIAAVLRGDAASFEPLVVKYSPRLFALVRRYARTESDVEDLVQEIWVKAHQKIASFRGDAPFEHWLTRIGVRCCYDFLRYHKRRPESTFTDLAVPDKDWAGEPAAQPESDTGRAAAARQLLGHVLSQLPAESRLVITLLEIEERSVKEIAELTGWSVPLVKVRAFRARAKMRKILGQIAREKYL